MATSKLCETKLSVRLWPKADVHLCLPLRFFGKGFFELKLGNNLKNQIKLMHFQCPLKLTFSRKSLSFHLLQSIL
jgi:hypothetical protein